MKVISIIQPWATLIAIGEKQFETRSWATQHRGPLAIHASGKIDKDVCRLLEPFKSVLAKHGFDETNLPTGCIIATCRLQQCYTIRRADKSDECPVFLDTAGRSLGWAGKKPNEYHFGDYRNGRFAWELVDVKQIEPIPTKGQLRLWNYQGGEINV